MHSHTDLSKHNYTPYFIVSLHSGRHKHQSWPHRVWWTPQFGSKLESQKQPSNLQESQLRK